MALKTLTQANLDAAIAASELFWKSNKREGYRAPLSGHDLSALAIPGYSCLVEGLFTKTRFNALNLSGCDFSNSSCQYTTFNNCNLASVDFSGSNLYGANFTNANLTNADLSGSFCQNANFTGATLTGVRWDNCDKSGTSGA